MTTFHSQMRLTVITHWPIRTMYFSESEFLNCNGQ